MPSVTPQPMPTRLGELSERDTFACDQLPRCRALLVILGQASEYFIAGHFEVCRYFVQDRSQRADSQAAVCGDCQMVLAALSRCQTEMTACLTRDHVSKGAKKSSEFLAGQVTRKPHTVRTSSFT